MPLTRGPLNPEHDKKIRKNWSYLLKNIDAQYVMDGFVDEGIFDIEEITEIRNKGTTTEKNRLFLEKLLESGPGAYQVFINVLNKNGYETQANTVYNTVVDLAPPRPPGL